MTQPYGTAVGTQGGASAFSVDQPSLDRVAGVVDTATSGTFQPTVTTIFDGYRGGTPVGQRIPRLPVQEVRDVHHENLSRASATLAGYLAASSVLVGAVRQVRGMFDDADLSSAEHAQTIEATLTGALTQAAAVQRQAEADRLRAEGERAAGAPWARDAAAYGSGYSTNPILPGEAGIA